MGAQGGQEGTWKSCALGPSLIQGAGGQGPTALILMTKRAAGMWAIGFGLGL